MKKINYDKFMENFTNKSTLLIECDDNSPYSRWIMNSAKKKHIVYTRELLSELDHVSVTGYVGVINRRSYVINITELGRTYLSFVLL